MIGGEEVFSISQVSSRSEYRAIYETETLEGEYFEKTKRHKWSSQLASHKGLGH